MTHLAKIKESLQAFATTRDLRTTAISFFNTLGYSSERTVKLKDVQQFLSEFDRDKRLEHPKALIKEWLSVELLFQLTDEEISQSLSLFKDDTINQSLLQSYVFIAVELKAADYARGKLAGITRQINRVFPMPVMVLYKIGEQLSIAVINRRKNKIHEDRDVLEKVTLIQNINITEPHRGHLDILSSFSVGNLKTTRTITNFDQLHTAWEEVFNVELLNKRFYSKIQRWFFWAVQEITFPHGGIADPDQRNRIAAIRLLTRVIFCWFAREKRLVPSELFSATTASKVLKNFDPLSRTDGTYYLAILQNLFFPTLSVPLDQREFRNGRRYKGVNKHYMNHAFFRHEAAFKEPDDIPRLFENIPFLNGGLFTCLDYLDKDKNEVRVDGFSDLATKQPLVPNLLFFGKDIPVNISIATGNPTDTAVKIDGLFTILDAFKFTVTENTPIEEEIALDPELLGRIFENLLAEYNPETEKTARKQTGSFYTPRDIVDYMVNESLKAYLHSALCRKLPAVTPADASEGLDILFTYTEREHAFTAEEKRILVDAIYDAAILDPACGSGAFPMGMLQKLVYVLDKLDHDRDHWKQRILADTPVVMKEQTRQWLDSASADFIWKLGLIQHSIYGIDIQPFAVQIAKLRCFVSLLVDFNVDPTADNCGVPSLPNLDFKFVAANTLISPPSEAERADDLLKLEDPFLKDFATLAEEYFFVRDPAEKKRLQDKIEVLIEQQIETHTNTHVNVSKAYLEENKRSQKLWESYRNIFAFRNNHVGFFEPRYFFPEIKDGFDIIIGNPPYFSLTKNSGEKDNKGEKIKYNKFYESQKFEVLVNDGDIYCLFYERGFQLLREGGHLCYITSNKWMRTGYGASLRQFFSKKSHAKTLIDFAGQEIFDSATVDTNILLLEKTTQGQDTLPTNAVIATADCRENLSLFVRHNAAPCRFDTSASWVILSPIERSIKEKIEKIGVPLKEWDISINYGIKTGFNKAFIITEQKRTEILANCANAVERKRTDELIRPILRGRDIKRYSYTWANLYIIATFPALRIDIEMYPAVKRYLLSFGIGRLEQTGRTHIINGERITARKKTCNKWFETQDQIGYWEDFSKPKILWAETMRIRQKNNERFPRFSYCPEPIFTDKTCFMAIGDDLQFVLAFLNSKVGRYQISQTVAILDNGGYLMQKMYIEQYRIAKVCLTVRTRLLSLVEKLLNASATVAQEEAENEIDEIVFDAFGISKDEQTFLKQELSKPLERG